MHYDLVELIYQFSIVEGFYKKISEDLDQKDGKDGFTAPSVHSILLQFWKNTAHRVKNHEPDDTDEACPLNDIVPDTTDLNAFQITK